MLSLLQSVFLNSLPSERVGDNADVCSYTAGSIETSETLLGSV